MKTIDFFEMKQLILILAILTITNISFGQLRVDSTYTDYSTREKWLAEFEKSHIDSIYIGFQEICWTNDRGKKECFPYYPKRPKRKWYHETIIAFSGDSVFVKQSPVSISKKDTLYSASDGGFYYYIGTVVKNNENVVIINLTETYCDYCGILMKKQEDGTYKVSDVKRTKTFVATITAVGLTINNQKFRKIGNGEILYW